MAGFPSPEAAATSSFPAAHCRVVGIRKDDDDAYVLLNTGSERQPYLYGVACHFRNGEWHEGADGNGGGWTLTDEASGLGLWALWDDAPPGADLVRIEFGGDISEHPIVDGAYLVTFFKQPSGIDFNVLAFRIDGSWQWAVRAEHGERR